MDANAGQRVRLRRLAQVDDLLLRQVFWVIRQGGEQQLAANAMRAQDAADSQEIS